MSDFPKGARVKRGKNPNDQNTQTYQNSLFSTETTDDIIIDETQEEPYYSTLSRENYRKLALLESLIREKECEIKRMAHDHQLAISQVSAQADFYKNQYSLMMEELQGENRNFREANMQLSANYEHAIENIQKLNLRMQKEKGEYDTREKRCEEILLKNQNDSNMNKKEFCKLQDRAQLLDKELQESRLRENNLNKELTTRTRALSNIDSQMQILKGENQNFEAKLVGSQKEIETYQSYLLAVENNFHNSFPRIARPHSTSQSFRFEWLVTTIRDYTQQLLADHQQLQSNVTRIEKDRDLLKNEQFSIYNTLMREISILQLNSQINEDSSNSMLLHLLSTKYKESLQSSELVMMEKSQENEFLNKEVGNLQTYITSLKQDKEDLQLSNTRLEQINKKSLTRIDTLQKENANLRKPDYTNPTHDVTNFSSSNCYSPSRQRAPNSVIGKSKQGMSNVERDKMFLLSQVESLSDRLTNNNIFQSTPKYHSSRTLSTHT